MIAALSKASAGNPDLAEQHEPDLSNPVRWSSIPEGGLALEPGALVDLPFVETKNLKYDPVAFKEAHMVSAGA